MVLLHLPALLEALPTAGTVQGVGVKRKQAVLLAAVTASTAAVEE